MRFFGDGWVPTRVLAHAWAGWGSFALARALGASAYVEKPLRVEEVIPVVRSLVGGGSLEGCCQSA